MSIDGSNNISSSSNNIELNNITTTLQPIISGIDLGSQNNKFDSLYVDNIYLSSLTNNKMIISNNNKIIESKNLTIIDNSITASNNAINYNSNICLNNNV